MNGSKSKHNIWEYILVFGKNDYRRFVMVGPAITEDDALRHLEMHFDPEKIVDFYPKKAHTR